MMSFHLIFTNRLSYQISPNALSICAAPPHKPHLKWALVFEAAMAALQLRLEDMPRMVVRWIPHDFIAFLCGLLHGKTKSVTSAVLATEISHFSFLISVPPLCDGADEPSGHEHVLSCRIPLVASLPRRFLHCNIRESDFGIAQRVEWFFAQPSFKHDVHCAVFTAARWSIERRQGVPQAEHSETPAAFYACRHQH